jgi:Tripartite tricarboxylate transporter TctB family
MLSANAPPGPDAPGHPPGSAATPRSDFIAALCWIVFGGAVSAGAWNMDRLENQDVPSYAVPGLLPFFLGLATVFFAVLMLARAWRQGALAADAARSTGMSPTERRRFLIVLTLCLTFAVVLVGHGLPFWLATALFVAVTISVLQYPQRRVEKRVLRGIVIAVVTGVCAGVGVTIVFQDIFLVHLP